MTYVSSNSSKSSWPTRHQTILDCLQDEAVQSLVVSMTNEPTVAPAFCKARDFIIGRQKATPHSNEPSHKDEVDDGSSAEQGLALDLALASWWSHSVDVRKRLYSPAAFQSLKSLSSAVPSPSDFPSVTSLQRSSAAYVEIVRCRFNRQLYVIKTVVKGLARRESHRCSPNFEAHLLSLGSRQSTESRPVPNLVASFQSQNSLHIVMEYFPAGDLDQLLHSAGEAAGDGVGLARNGGLLDETFVKAYTTDIVAAVGWCHQQGFMHRDVKPANFLLDRTGHLKLCDFATAAPFSTFAGQRRRVHRFYSCLAGTPDYIAPDILLGEEERLNAEAKNECWMGSTYGDSTVSFSRTRAIEPAPDSEGAYGPEIDWWSVGVVVYEMVYKVVPFWAESIREAHYRIRNHEEFLRLDESIPTSPALDALIRGLLCNREKRLGASPNGTQDIQQHDFFQGVQWDSYMSAPAPFVPNLPSSSLTQTTGLSPSVLHSPRPLAAFAHDESISVTPESIALSQIYEGDPDEFPAFVDSRDDVMQEEHTLVEKGKESMTVAGEHVDDHLQPSWPSHPRATTEPALSAPNLEQNEQGRWQQMDLDWLGFSRLPVAEAFGPTPRPLSTLPLPMTTPVITRMRSFSTILEASPACSSAAASPETWTRCGGGEVAPMASTPYGTRASVLPHISPSVRFASQPTPLPSGSATTPYTFTRKKSLQRRALEISSRLATPGDGTFFTPARKASMPGAPSGIPNQQEPAVPASPYPFPVAVRATPGPSDLRRVVSTVTTDRSAYRGATQSPHSSSGVASMGSESRCSGGSNAKRDVSENEAMELLVQAVAQSARKVRIASEDKAVHDRLSALEDKLSHRNRGAALLNVGKQSRPPLQHSHTDSDADSLQTRMRLHQRRGTSPNAIQQPLRRRRSASDESLPAVSNDGMIDSTNITAGIAGAQIPSPPDQPLRQISSTSLPSSVPSIPLVTAPSPTSQTVSSQSRSEQGCTVSPPARGLTGDCSQSQGSIAHASVQVEPNLSPSSSTSSCASSTASNNDFDHEQLRPPSFGLGKPTLRNRRSHRQLKLEAQERTTPTRPARVNPPQIHIDRFERLSLYNSSAGDQTHEGDSTPGLTTDGGAGSETESLDADSLHSDAHSMFAALKVESPTRLGGGSLSKLQSYWDSEPAVAAPIEIIAKSVAPSSSNGSRLGLQPLSLEATRLRSKSYGQLPKLRLSLGSPSKLTSGALNLIQEEQQRRGSSSSSIAGGRSLRKKDSRETLSEYRKGIGRPATPTSGLTSPFLPSSMPGTPDSLHPVIHEDDAFGGGALVPAAVIPVRGMRKTMRRASSATLGHSYAQGKGVMACFDGEGDDIPIRSSTTLGQSLPAKERRSSISPLMPSSSSSRNSLLSITEEIGTSRTRTEQKKVSQQPKQLRRAKSRLSIMTSPTFEATTESSFNSLGSTSSPLTKMDQRYGGLQNSFDGLQDRLTDIKARLKG